MNHTSIRKSEDVSKTEKNVFFAQKIVKIFQNSGFAEIQFSQKSLIDIKNQPHTLPQQVLVQQTPMTQRVARSAEWQRSGDTGKDTKILKNGARGYKSSPDQIKAQNQTFQTRYR